MTIARGPSFTDERPTGLEPIWRSPDRRLVGRTAELEAIDRALETVRGGVAHAVALVGEAGIGKTALLQAASDRAAAAGIPMLRGQATEFEAEVPFGIFVEALDSALERQLSPPSELGADRLDELARVFPSLAGVSTVKSTGLQAERFRLHYAVRGALEQLASTGPLVLALDDVHWADPSSIELLTYLLRHGLSAPLVLCLAYRPALAPESLAQAAAAAGRDGWLTTLDLNPLTLAEADSLLGGELDPDARSRLYHDSGGNPFYLVELARARAARTGSGAADPLGGNGERPEVPAGARALITEEVGSASASAQSLLRGAAIVGEPFELELAAAAAGLPKQVAISALDELGHLELIKTSEVPGRYQFRHPIICRAVYEAAGSGFTPTAHRRVAELLERWGASPATRAHHIERSAQVGDMAAISVLTEAGSETALRAPATAARWFRAALRLLPTDAPPERRLELLIALATSLATSGSVEESRARLAEALTLLSPEQLVIKARLAGAIARLDHMTGRHGGARELLERAVGEVGANPSEGSTALRLELAMDHWFADEWEPTVVAARAARADARAIGDQLSYAMATGLEAVGRGYLGKLDRARELADETSAIIDRLSDAQLATRVEALVVLSHAEFGGIERASASARHADRGIAISRATGQDSWYPLLMSERCVANLLLGRLAEADEAANVALEAARLGHFQTQIWALTLRSWVDLLIGDLDSAIKHGEEAIAIVERTDTGLFNWLAYGCLAMALIEAGEPHRGRSLILEHAGGAQLELVDRAWLPHWYETLTFAELASGDLAAARQWATRAEAAARAFPTPGRLGEASHARAAVEFADGKLEAAVAAALEASDRFAAAEWPIDSARARTLAARGLATLGARDRAIELLHHALAELDAFGARGYRDQAAQALRALGERVRGLRGVVAEGVLETLSPRQRDVAELVARGMANKQIAAELVVSLKTVESHMTRILAKTGAPSRAAVAAAVERSNRAQDR